MKLQRFSSLSPTVPGDDGENNQVVNRGISGREVFTAFLRSSRPEQRMRNQAMKDDDDHQNDIDHLLLTVLLPSYPPNRSQWKKLEHALHFINQSRTSSSSQQEKKYFQNKRRTENYYLQSEQGLDVRQGSVPCTGTVSVQLVVDNNSCLSIIISGSEDRIYSQEY